MATNEEGHLQQQEYKVETGGRVVWNAGPGEGGGKEQEGKEVVMFYRTDDIYHGTGPEYYPRCSQRTTKTAVITSGQK